MEVNPRSGIPLMFAGVAAYSVAGPILKCGKITASFFYSKYDKSYEEKTSRLLQELKIDLKQTGGLRVTLFLTCLVSARALSQNAQEIEECQALQQSVRQLEAKTKDLLKEVEILYKSSQKMEKIMSSINSLISNSFFSFFFS